MIDLIIYIPGFGMTADEITIKVSDEKSITLKPINPDWKNLSSIEKVADQVRDELNKIRIENPGVNFGVYGFSLGGDLLMDLINRNKFDFTPGSVVLMTDPNLNSINCFITKIAEQSDSRTEFINTLRKHNQNANNMTNAHWSNYFDHITKNIPDIDSSWENFKAIASSVIKSADLRYKSFVDTVKIDGKTLSGVPIKILLSEEQKSELKKDGKTPTGFKWIESIENLKHFNGMDAGTIHKEMKRFIESQNLT